MIDDRNTLTITGGQDVFGADGGKVGSVAGIDGDYLVVSKGFFFPTDYYIPTSAINTVNDDGVFLTVSKDEALNQGWDVVPSTTTTQPVTTDAYVTDRELSDRAIAGANANDQAVIGEGTVDDGETIRVPLSEEELTAQKRAVDRGAVHVDKVVTEQQQTLDVPVTEERVNVARRVVDREVAPDDATFEEGTIEVPVRGEEVVVDKRARVREELEIEKERVQGTQQVTDTVRREEARVTDDTGTVIDDQDRPIQ